MTSYKSIILVALVLMLACVPLASAEWMSGVWYPSDVYANMIAGDTVIHSSLTGVDSKYNPNVGSKYDIQQDPNTYSGSVVFIIRSGMATLNPTLVLVNDAMPDVNKTYDIPENAVLEIDGLPAGNFTATLNNYDLPDETAHFVIAVAQQQPTRVAFIGQAASQPAMVHIPVITILRAQYGIITLVSPEIPGYYTIQDVPRVYGNCEETEGFFYDFKVGNQKYVFDSHGDDHYVKNGNQYTVTEVVQLTGNCEESHGSHYDFMVGNEKFVFDNHGDDLYTYHAEIPAVYSGTIVDVTSNVRTVISAGYTTFLFNNAQNPGGIFDKTTTTLLSPIADPAPGQVKNVVITYNVDGGMSKTINSQEYQIISLI